MVFGVYFVFCCVLCLWFVFVLKEELGIGFRVVFGLVLGLWLVLVLGLGLGLGLELGLRLGLGLGLSRYLDSLTNGDTDQLFNPNILSLMT